MRIDRKELKRQARQTMKSCRPGPMRVALVYLLLTVGVSTAVGLMVPNPFTQWASYVAMGMDPTLAMTVSVGGVAALAMFTPFCWPCSPWW